MKKKINIIPSLLLIFIISVPTFSQGPGGPYFPETANGANYIHSTGHRLLWQNPDSTVFNMIFFIQSKEIDQERDCEFCVFRMNGESILT